MAPEVKRTPLGRATIGDQLRRHARTQGDKLALAVFGPDGTRSAYTYAELNGLVNKAASALAARGVGRGDRIAMMSHNSIDFVIAYYAGLKLGAAMTGINFTFRAEEITYQVDHAEPVVLIVEDALIDRVPEGLPSVRTKIASTLTGADVPDGWETFEALLESGTDTEPEGDVDEDDLCMVVYTSGTEAFPKGVMISHRNYLTSTAPAWGWGVNTDGRDTWLFVMPFHTIAGLGSMTSLTIMGATLVLPYAADAKSALKMISEEGVTVMAQTPAFYQQICAQPDFGAGTVGTLRQCMTYGGTVPQPMIEAWSSVLPDITWGTYWGQSELAQLGTVGWFRTLQDIPNGDASWIGKPVTHLETRIVGEDGADSDHGELWCRSPSAMVGYYKDEERTAEVFADGWVHTGDIVKRDDDGNLFFYDRLKDMIKTGGMNVSSQEVERAIYAVQGVAQVAVVGVPDDYWSEAVNAFVVGEAEPDAIIAHCKEHLAGFKVPKAVHIVDELPRDSQGKLLKRELRKTV